ncbi:MAG: efflux RND transporter permease subunit, partial [Bacteroidota bacterium]
MDKINEKELREFSLSSIAVDNSTSIFLLTMMIFFFGIFAYIRMPKEQYPDASMPTVYVNTPYFGNSAADIENLVSRPLEKEIMGITGIKDVNSTSMQDYSVITAEFEADLDIDDVVRKVKDAVDKAKSELPNDLTEDPTVLEVNFSEIPIVTVNISGDFTMDELRSYAEFLEDEIEDLSEISKVDIKGALEREVKVDLDLVRMQALQVTFQDVENAIASENMNMSGGEILNNDFRRAVRIVGEFENVEEMNDLIVKSENQRPIYLKDIGKVTFDFEDRTSYARSDQQPVVSLDVIKRSGGNLLDASDKIVALLAEAQEKHLPEDLKVSLFNDQSVNTRVQVASLQNSIVSGVILVVLVLLFFLGLRNSMFVGLAIPISMLTGILILFVNGTIMNIVVLFALILALGLLVDNAIVVVENIYRYMQNGYSGKMAAKYGAGEVAWPIIASTATTLAAFLPLAFWPGLMGEFMFYLPYTLIIVLASSLFVALVINPVFTARYMKVDKKVEDKRDRRTKLRNFMIGIVVMTLIAVGGHFAGIMWIRNLFGIVVIVSLVNYFLLRPSSFFFQNKVIPLLEKGYDKFIRRALKRYTPLSVFFGTILLLVGAIGLLGVKSPPVEFFPSADPIYINVFVELPMGKDIEATNVIMKDLEATIEKTVEKNDQIVEAVLSQIGENTSDPNSPPEPGVTPHKARLTVSFVPTEERGGISTKEIMEEIRENLVGYPGVQITVDKNADGPPTGKPINLELRGEDIDELAVLSEDVLKFINSKGIPGIEELKSDVTIG